jgi:hypothetical protein
MLHMKELSGFGLALLVSVVASGCATSFTGSPYVEGGRSGCEAKCRSAGMEVVGLVYMGEYSDACVCGAPGQSASRKKLLMAATGAAAGAGAGVAMQMQRQAQQQQHH